MRACQFTAAAEGDLREIARYTARQWGEAQSLRYAALLEKCFAEIAAGKRPSRAPLAQRPLLRLVRCERHRVFYLVGEDRLILIVAVLHEKLDILRRLKQRLP